ncbi:4'-phosphopantetheinyl transferase superfamily protein [Streptomyces sp. NPDC032472]|uniref:4'-phosphopantetheinyl transferase family protein n=1 Tax=Streptomyces sp. NPDC032472 TaxID=3155018 RepID=UPI0033E18DEA
MSSADRLAEPHPVGRPDVHLARVAPGLAHAERHAGVLSAAERARMARFAVAADRDRYLTAHVALRILLGRRLGQRPEDVPITHAACAGCGGPHGRPVVPGNPVHFSLSHAGEFFVIAFSEHAAVGVDVERVPPSALPGALHPEEEAELALLAPADRPAAFARAWTRKEAVLKALGTGLQNDPTTLLVGTAPTPRAHPAWHLTPIPTPPTYAATRADPLHTEQSGSLRGPWHGA